MWFFLTMVCLLNCNFFCYCFYLLKLYTPSVSLSWLSLYGVLSLFRLSSFLYCYCFQWSFSLTILFFFALFFYLPSLVSHRLVFPSLLLFPPAAQVQMVPVWPWTSKTLTSGNLHELTHTFIHGKTMWVHTSANRERKYACVCFDMVCNMNMLTHCTHSLMDVFILTLLCWSVCVCQFTFSVSNLPSLKISSDEADPVGAGLVKLTPVRKMQNTCWHNSCWLPISSYILFKVTVSTETSLTTKMFQGFHVNKNSKLHDHNKQHLRKCFLALWEVCVPLGICEREVVRTRGAQKSSDFLPPFCSSGSGSLSKLFAVTVWPDK